MSRYTQLTDLCHFYVDLIDDRTGPLCQAQRKAITEALMACMECAINADDYQQLHYLQYRHAQKSIIEVQQIMARLFNYQP